MISSESCECSACPPVPFGLETDPADGAWARDKAAGEGVNQDDVPRPEDG
jgi:hypothetical protein